MIYCNRTLIVKVIVENVVTCFLLGHSVYGLCTCMCVLLLLLTPFQLVVVRSLLETFISLQFSSLVVYSSVRHLISQY